MNFTRIRKSPAFYFLLALLVLWTPLLWRITRPFITAILLAVVLSVVVYPTYEGIRKGVRRSGLAAGLTTLLSLAAVAAVVTVVGVVLSAEVAQGYRTLDAMSSEEGGWSAFATHTMDRSIEFIASKIDASEATLREQINGGLRNGAALALEALRDMATALTSGLVNFVFASIFLYFFLRHGSAWVKSASALLPLEPRATEHLLGTLRDTIIANVNGVLVVAIAQGGLLFVGLYVAGITGAFLWALLGGIASVIPILGATLVWVPCVLWLLVEGRWMAALLLAIWCALVVGSADNVLRPLVVGGRVQQHPILIAFAMIGGAQAFGAAGVLIGPVVLAFFFAVIKELGLLMNREIREPEVPAEGTARQDALPS